MSQITIDLTSELEERVGVWKREKSGDTAVLITEALDKYLEDWEDYTDAVRICAEVDAGRMRTYSREDINREMDARVEARVEG